MSTFRITPAATAADLQAVRGLFREYAASLKVDLACQGFEAELAALPGCYAEPRGCVLLAVESGMPLGCVALRPLAGAVCEMKRLFVREQARGRGVGRMLAEQAITEARKAGYDLMRLDTLPDMAGAVRLYESLGFRRCAAYYETPLAETVFLELNLASP